MRHPFVAFAFCLLAQAAGAQSGAAAPTAPVRSSTELIKTSPRDPRTTPTVTAAAAGAADTAPVLQVAGRSPDDLTASATTADGDAVSAGPLALALAALALMTGIALRRTMTGPR